MSADGPTGADDSPTAADSPPAADSLADAGANTDWPTAADWLASPAALSAPLVVAGVPLVDGAVSAGARYDLTPAAVRARLAKLSTFHGERLVSLPAAGDVHDLGDALEPPPLRTEPAALTVLLGGHNGVTFAALQAREDLPRWGLLTLDAHHDVRPYATGTTPGNGSPVRALIDAGLPGGHVVQVGIAGFSNSPHHRAWCESAGITVLGPDRVGEVGRCLDVLAGLVDHIYVDIDVDVLDRAFAPGCPGARPGGIHPRDLFDAAFTAGAHPAVRAVDIVEVDAAADVASITVDAAALSLLNVCAGYASRTTSSSPST